jgi:hypothetical protein
VIMLFKMRALLRVVSGNKIKEIFNIPSDYNILGIKTKILFRVCVAVLIVVFAFNLFSFFFRVL